MSYGPRRAGNLDTGKPSIDIDSSKRRKLPPTSAFLSQL